MNFPTPHIAKACGWNDNLIRGWNTVLIDCLVQQENVELTIFFPQHRQRETIRGSAKIDKGGRKVNYVGFYEKPTPEMKYNHKIEQLFREELMRINPDLIHIWGTEYLHTLCMVNAYNDPNRTVVSIQGIISVIGEHYTDYLPRYVVNHLTFRDWVRRDGIKHQKDKFIRRGLFEIETLKKIGHVAGRTEWDHQELLTINPKLKYHHCREFLRPSFSDAPKWAFSKCDKHTVFMAQADYPVKGMHIALKILSEVKKVYSDVKIYLAGKNLIATGIKEQIKRSSYSTYTIKLINDYGLAQNVIFLGQLNEQQMISQYIKTNVFLQASVMENSPNSLGEAMYLGVPCVASDVGGTSSFLKNEEDGILYDHSDLSRAVEGIIRAFKGDRVTIQMAETGQKKAALQYDYAKGYKEYMDMYTEMLRDGTALGR